jgi:uncharacterized SAM-binding protein YcdF (DUF218 family)
MAPRSSPRLRALVVLLLLLVILGIFGVRNLGHWLIRQDALEHADAIVVLSGGLPYRAEGAAEVFKQGYAPEVWISLPASPQKPLEEMGIHYIGEEEYAREILIHRGVPSDHISVFPQEIVDTEEEIAEVAKLMHAQGKHTVIIVTSPEHTRRVRALWNAIARRDANSDLTAVVRAASTDPFDADHWWRTTRDSLAVARETLGLINVWFGLPVRPRT